MSDHWAQFKERVSPRMESYLRRSLGPDVKLVIDYASIGDEPKLDQSLEYDLEMLGRGLEASRLMGDPLPAETVRRIREGIRRVQVRRVKKATQRRLAVENGTLHVDFCWDGGGRFGPRDVEAILADRDQKELAKWVSPLDERLPPALDEFRRNSLPAAHVAITNALGRPVPMRFDWKSLNESSDDAGNRVAHMLDELSSALRSVAERKGHAVGPAMVHDRADAMAQERYDIVTSNTREIHVRGGRVGDEPVISFHDGCLHLCVFQDAAYTDTSGDRQRTVDEIRRFPGGTARELEQMIKDLLDLEVGPLLRRIQREDFVTAREHVHPFVNKLIENGRFGVSERIDLQDTLDSRGIELEVDWDTLLPPHISSRDKLSVLGDLETGHYNYNSHYGSFFKDFFECLREAAHNNDAFVKQFVERVRAVRFEHVAHAGEKELVSRGSTLLFRQCPHEDRGCLTYSDNLPGQLKAVVAAMSESAPGGGEADSVEGLLANIVEAFEGDVVVDIDPSLRAVGDEVLRQRVLAPLLGAVHVLKSTPGYAETLLPSVATIALSPCVDASQRGCEYHEGALRIRIAPAAGAEGCYDSAELVEAMDNALALRSWAGIADQEAQQRGFWERMLRERFERDLLVEIDWPAFLADPEHGGNTLYPYDVRNAAVDRLIYAITGFMDDDKSFRDRARKHVDGVIITAAPSIDAKSVTLEDRMLVYRCHTDRQSSYGGFFSINDLQRELHRALPRG